MTLGDPDVPVGRFHPDESAEPNVVRVHGDPPQDVGSHREIKPLLLLSTDEGIGHKGNPSSKLKWKAAYSRTHGLAMRFGFIAERRGHHHADPKGPQLSPKQPILAKVTANNSERSSTCSQAGTEDGGFICVPGIPRVFDR